jgi:hypothetical protein
MRALSIMRSTAWTTWFDARGPTIVHLLQGVARHVMHSVRTAGLFHSIPLGSTSGGPGASQEPEGFGYNDG